MEAGCKIHPHCSVLYITLKIEKQKKKTKGAQIIYGQHELWPPPPSWTLDIA